MSIKSPRIFYCPNCGNTLVVDLFKDSCHDPVMTEIPIFNFSGTPPPEDTRAVVYCPYDMTVYNP